MEYVAPIAVGLIAGVVGGVPYAVALAVQKKRRDASILPAMIAVCVSIVVIALSTLVGWIVLRETVFVFAIALVVAFLATVTVGVVVYGRKPRP